MKQNSADLTLSLLHWIRCQWSGKSGMLKGNCWLSPIFVLVLGGGGGGDEGGGSGGVC